MSTLTRRLLLTEANYVAARERRKSQTRRVLIPPPTVGEGRRIAHIGPALGGAPDEFRTWLDRTDDGKGRCEYDYNPEVWHCPYGPPGTRLALTEAFRAVVTDYKGVLVGRRRDHAGNGLVPVEYRYDGKVEWRPLPDSHWDKPAAQPRATWLPALFMPLWAARCFTRSTAVRVEKLRDITEADAIDEGLRQNASGQWLPAYPSVAGWLSPITAFESLWDSINTQRGYSWAGAGRDWPGFVWAITFEEPREEAESDECP